MKKPSLTRRERMRYLEAAEQLHKNDEGYQKAENTSFLLYVLLVVVFALSLRLFIFEPIRVDGSSMISTLLDGEQMFVEKVSYWFTPPKRGEVVIVFYPNHTISCVKRVVGLPGETVSVKDGAVYINGEPLDESAYWNHYV